MSTMIYSGKLGQKIPLTVNTAAVTGPEVNFRMFEGFSALTPYLVFNAVIISDANVTISPVLMLFHYLRPHGYNNYTLSRCQHVR